MSRQLCHRRDTEAKDRETHYKKARRDSPGFLFVMNYL
jgi:hypothetical protein